MHGTTRHGQRGPGSRREATGTPMYWGWSPDSGRMEMMDLRRYVDSLRAGYDRSLEDLYQRMSALSGAFGGGAPWMPAAGTAPGRRRHGSHGPGCCDDDADEPDGGCGHGHHHGRHRHGQGCGHHHRKERDCADDDDCRCECCIVDADIVVYARCGEVRVVPIEIDNDTRKDREDVELEVSGFRSGGGRELPWKAAITPPGPLTIKGCSTARLELLVAVVCPSAPSSDDPAAGPKAAKEPARPSSVAAGAPADQLVRLATNVRHTGAVDSCTVGYLTVRVGGCLVRPIVVAVAVLPDDCGAYSAPCSCGDCC